MGSAILVRFLVAGVLLVPGWVIMAHMKGGGGGAPPPGSPAAQAAELQSSAELVQAARLLSDYHRTHSTFAGASLASIPETRLVRADASTFCAEAGEQTWLYHLDGTTQEDNSWNWGAVKGPCASQ